MTTQLLTAGEVENAQLDRFLSRFYTPAKCRFLAEYGAWRHGGDEHRWVLTIDNQIVGYCAVIPTTINSQGNHHPALWWVDIIVAPEFRGRGLQTHFDEKIKTYQRVKLGFPNQLAAKIHRKHGWGVREDLQIRLVPLKPLKVNQVRQAHGWRGALLKFGALALSPIAWLLRAWLKTYQPKSVWRVDSPSAAQFASVYARYAPPNFATTHRDPDYFTQRFLNAPHHHQLRYYLCGPQDAPSHFLITRTFNQDGVTITRFLDLYGDFSDQSRVRDLVLCALGDSVRSGACQVTCMATLTALNTHLKKSGFVFSTTARFCWLSDDKKVTVQLGHQIHWSLADSDNDEIT